jgi:hypothetical protein
MTILGHTPPPNEGDKALKKHAAYCGVERGSLRLPRQLESEAEQNESE